MNKYTAIYVDSWMSGSHMHSLTKMCRFESKEQEIFETLETKHRLDRNQVIFIFHGHPVLEGENNG